MKNLQTTVFGGGCFWCLEAVFDRMEGVTAVESGYMGGHVDNPTYRQVCNGDTGHVEVVRITFDPTQASFSDLLDVNAVPVGDFLYVGRAIPGSQKED
jgi:peptide-methionine (S)-S-oxide reductase